MTDRELLERAAKAAGIKAWAGKGHQDQMLFTEPAATSGIVTGVEWSPLTDDGDALRLAVRLRITPNIDSNMTEAEAATTVEGGFFAEPHLDDAYAATRRAIVRAAAAMSA